MPSAAIRQSDCVTASPPDRPEESDHFSAKSAFTVISPGARDRGLARSEQPWQDECQ